MKLRQIMYMSRPNHPSSIRPLIVAFALSFSTLTITSAQSTDQSILDYLTRSEPGKGTIKIFQPDCIRALVSRRSSMPGFTVGDDAVMKMRGYRVQVYSGNRPNSRAIATSREAKVKEAIPELDTYVNYEAPFWKLRVGNFPNSLEAQQALSKLKAALPEFRREMYVVRDQIFVPR